MFQVLHTAHLHSLFWLVTFKYADINVGLQFFVQTPHAVQWMRPEAQDGCQVSDWFNILVLHQNRLSVCIFLESMH